MSGAQSLGDAKAAAAAFAGAFDPSLIAQMANALFSAAPGHSVPSMGVAPPSLPGAGVVPTGSVVPPASPAIPGVGHVTTEPRLPQVGPLAAVPTPPPGNPTAWPPTTVPGPLDLRSLPNLAVVQPPECGDGRWYFLGTPRIGAAAAPALPEAGDIAPETPPPVISAPVNPAAASPILAKGGQHVLGTPRPEPELPRVPTSFAGPTPPQPSWFDRPVALAASPRFDAVDFSALSVQLRPDQVPDLGAGSRPFDANSVKRDFPILQEQVNGKPLIWLDNAATTQKPKAVIDRLAYFYEHENSNIHRAAHTLAARATDAYEAARDKVRRFLGAASPDEIIFVRGATEGINLVAQSWGRRNIGKDDEIVVTWLEHHANIVPWQQLCAETGARLRVAPVDDSGQVLLDEYEKLLNPRTKLVSFTQVSNALGTVTPAAEMTAIAHRHGARVLVDGAQAVSHMPVDVQALDCDFYVFSGHKVFGPTGIGAVYGKPEVLADMPAWQGGGNMIADVTFEKTVYQPPPSRFEAGTGNIADAVGLGAAIDYVQAIGMATIAAWEHRLLDYGTEALLGVPGLKLIGTAKEKAGVLSFVMDGCRTEDIGKALDREGIAVRSGHHCAQPILRRFGLEATVRPSLAFYNTCEDVDALVAVLLKLQGRN